MSNYEKETQRIKTIQAELGKIRRSLNPAWRGLNNHPDQEEVQMRLDKTKSSIDDAIVKCGWLIWELEGQPED